MTKVPESVPLNSSSGVARLGGDLGRQAGASCVSLVTESTSLDYLNITRPTTFDP
jgi:hypothetical protein